MPARCIKIQSVYRRRVPAIILSKRIVIDRRVAFRTVTYAVRLVSEIDRHIILVSVRIEYRAAPGTGKTDRLVVVTAVAVQDDLHGS